MFMDEILKKNFDVIEKRWPDIFKKILQADLSEFTVEVEQNTLIIDGIQLTSNYDRIAEAKLQAELIPLDSKVAYIYGVGLGDLPQTILARSNIDKVFVYLLNVNLFLHVINVIELDSWLSDERVVLVDASVFKEVNSPFAAVPAELALADNSAAQIRDRVLLELDSEFISVRHKEDHVGVAESIENNLHNIQSDPSIESLILSNLEQVYIAAAGPTLAEHIDLLKNNQMSQSPITLIAVDTAVKSLLDYDIVPDIVISIDQVSHHTFESIDHNKLSECSLIYFPRIKAGIIDNWPGKHYCAYSQEEIYKNINDKYPKTKLFTSGSVIHPAIDFAVQKGVKSIVLLGADFGFPNNQAYVDGQDVIGTDKYTSSAHWVLNGNGERITTMLNYRGYLRDLEQYIANKPNVKFINGSLEGAAIAGTNLLKQ